MIWRQGPSLWGPCRTVFLKKLFVVKMIGSWESYDRVLSVWSTRYLGEAAGAFKVSGPVFNNKTAKWQCVPRDLATWAANVSVVLMRKWSGPGVPDADTAPLEKGSLCGAMAQLLWRLHQPKFWILYDAGYKQKGWCDTYVNVLYYACKLICKTSILKCLTPYC